MAVGQGDDHDVALVRVYYRPAANVVSGVGDDGEREGRRGLGMEVLADLAHPAFDLTLDLAAELRAALCVESRIGELLQRTARDPFRIDRKQLAARQPEAELDHLAADPDVALEHLRREVLERLLEDVLPRGASG